MIIRYRPKNVKADALGRNSSANNEQSLSDFKNKVYSIDAEIPWINYNMSNLTMVE